MFISNSLDIYFRSRSTTVSSSCAGNAPANALGWNATFCAGFVKGLLDSGMASDTGNITENTWREIIGFASCCASDSTRTGENVISEEFIRTLRHQIQ